VALKIPTTLGLISFALAGSACSDAHKLAKAYEKVCKAQCECEPETEYWNDVKNCKNACEGYADAQKASLKDQFEDEEPCGDLGKIAKDLKACADEGCSGIDECVSQLYGELAECLGSSYYYYGLSSPEHEARAIQHELSTQLLYGPIPLECSSEDEDRSPLCDALGMTE
jgi:hypothetical protein